MRQEFHIERRDKLLQAAADVFSEKGYAGSTILDVAARAGMGKGTVYGYFSSKEELFFDLFAWYAHQVFSGMPMPSPGEHSSTKEILVAHTQGIVGQIMGSLDMYPLTLEFWAAAATGNLQDRMKKAMAEIYEEYRAMIEAMLQEGIQKNEFHSDTHVKAISAGIVGALDALGLQYWISPDFDVMASATHTVRAILTGIASSPESQAKGQD